MYIDKILRGLCDTIINGDDIARAVKPDKMQFHIDGNIEWL